MRLSKENLQAWIKEYPIPLFTFVALIVGIFFFVTQQKQIAHYIWYFALIAGGAPIIYETFVGMLRGRFASDIVAMLAIITAAVMNQAFAGAIVVLMQSGGEAIEKYGLRRASSSLDALLKRAPRNARRKKGEQLEDIDVKEVKIGDILIVRQGDLIPVDGTIVQGEAEIDEAALTGEPLARLKAQGARVLSGSIDVNGAFEMRADKLSQESQYAKIVQLVRKAQEEKAPIQRLADKYAIYFTPLTIVIALLGWLFTQEPTTILSVLVVATPCPLILATPVAVISGVNRAAEEGIIVKGGAPLEEIGRVTAAVFDKTGTITYGTPSIDQIIPLNHVSKEELLYKAACVEQLSSHSAAQAIIREAKKEKEKLPFPSNFHETPGRGVEGDIDQQHVVIGSQTFLEQKLGADCLKGKEEPLFQARSMGKLITFVALNDLFAGIIVLSDHIREDIPEMMQRLKQLGVRQTVLLTGDSLQNTQVIAQQAGITHVKANLLPDQKVEAIKEIMQTHPNTLMVGDGINDAPALATATVGVAMGAQGTAISAEAADIVLLVDDVTKVADAVYIGQRMLRIATQSILIGLGLSLLLMVIAALGHIEPAVGALLQEIIDASVILNALRAR
ncbi:MAG TPA: heavy metal translocating P-type ATPase [Rhabdochlamydiaceae bacterium]|jgi:heavy metal translocating P-type ATPase